MAKDVCVIDRSKWVRGDKYAGKLGGAVLLTTQGGMCCLGFYSRQVLKMRKRDILGVDFPKDEWIADDPKIAHTYWGELEYHVHKGIGNINDDEHLPEREREKLIKTAFKEVLNCDVRFVGRSPRRD